MIIQSLPIYLKQESPNFKEPIRATDHAGAWDVFATEIIKEADDCYVVKLGFSAEFHTDFKLMIAPRSGITKTKWNIQNTPGIGDADFRGEYSIRFRAFPSGLKTNGWHKLQVKNDGSGDIESPTLKYPPFPYKVGDRVAQIYFQRRVEVQFIPTLDLSETKRGSGAYGSTGK